MNANRIFTLRFLFVFLITVSFLFSFYSCTSKQEQTRKEDFNLAFQDSIQVFRELMNKMTRDPMSVTSDERQRIEKLGEWFQENKVPPESVLSPGVTHALNPMQSLVEEFKRAPKKNLNSSDSLGIFHSLFLKSLENPMALSNADRIRLATLGQYIQINNIPGDSIFTPEELQIIAKGTRIRDSIRQLQEIE